MIYRNESYARRVAESEAITHGSAFLFINDVGNYVVMASGDDGVDLTHGERLVATFSKNRILRDVTVTEA